MSLRLGLILMLWIVTGLAGIATLGWAAADAFRTAERELRTTLVRAGMVLERNYHMEPRVGDPLYAEWTSIKLLGVMAPGTCVEFEQRAVTNRRLCAGWQVFGPIPPERYRQLAGHLFEAPQPVSREGAASQNGAFRLQLSFDPLAVTTLSWQRVRLALWQTMAMAAGVLALGTLAIFWRLGPVGGIVTEVDRLATGDLGARIAPTGAEEFRRIAAAVNRLATQLRAGAERQRALTRKLLEVEDVERRQLARDLHDEFGQTLTATNALATSIGIAARDRPDIVRDARSIGANIGQMMECLRGAFARLRPPDLEEVGLYSSLRTMLAGWEVQRDVRLTLEATLPEQAIPEAVSLDLYRIVQESVTNAMRHGTPETVRVSLARIDGGLRLVVQDDGGGKLHAERSGHGVLGIRERVAALGGQVAMRETGSGVQVQVTIPCPAEVRAA